MAVSSLKTGDPRSSKLQVTCSRCNNGWINHVDDNVKDLLLALKDGRWGRFTPWQRRVFAAWAARFAMVYEFADPPTVVASFEEREYLRLSRYPPNGWYVLIGYYQGTKWAGQYNHRSALVLEDDQDAVISPKAASVSDERNVQSTIATVGRLVFNVIGGWLDWFDIHTYADTYGLQVVWPESFPTFSAPKMLLGDEALDSMMDFFGGPAPEPPPSSS